MNTKLLHLNQFCRIPQISPENQLTKCKWLHRLRLGLLVNLTTLFTVLIPTVAPLPLSWTVKRPNV